MSTQAVSLSATPCPCTACCPGGGRTPGEAAAAVATVTAALRPLALRPASLVEELSLGESPLLVHCLGTPGVGMYQVFKQELENLGSLSSLAGVVFEDGPGTEDYFMTSNLNVSLLFRGCYHLWVV